MNDQAATGAQLYYPELGHERPAADMEARLCHYGKHYYASTPLELKGVGITLIDTHSDERRNGWRRYRVTLRAMAALESKYRVAMEALL